MTDNSWCVENVSYNGVDYEPSTAGLHIIGFCNERIEFLKNGTIKLPGFNTYPISGLWQLYGDTLEIRQVDRFPKMLEGSFHVEVNQRRMILKSSRTIIYCNQSHF